ncbi:hypothetical protein Tsubulata_001919 [Turnera subulata]|uniref:F-box domain-containing protein n=1 Tax=Turnera subulata TaxID=218843 RepID=A0A9Q0FLW3_9ROSI|nr:hypothetical protein Tsubulata_001919 [Turnera subulata]
MKESKMATVDGVSAALSCDDILCEILSRLPPQSVIRSITVAKRWLHFICSPSFGSHYLSRWQVSYNLLGFFVCNTLYLGRRHQDGLCRPKSEPALPFLSTSNEGDDLKFSGILKQLGFFIDSSNGLLLCGRHPRTYFVWNPISKQQCRLPHPRVFFEDLCMAFLVDDYPSDNMLYKVIRAKCECKLDTKTVAIETFDSRTSTWHYSTLNCSSTLSLSPWTVAAVINGVVHWFAEQGNIAVYDPDNDKRNVVLIRLPSSNDFDERAIGVSSDRLLQYGCSTKSETEIWVLEKERKSFFCTSSSSTSFDSCWKLRYRLNFKLMWKKNPTLMVAFWSRSKETQILSFLPQNSESVLIRCGSDIFLLNLASQHLEVVRYSGRGSSIMWDFSRVVPYFRPAWPHISHRVVSP